MGINGSLEPVVGARGRFWDGSSNEPRCILSPWSLESPRHGYTHGYCCTVPSFLHQLAAAASELCKADDLVPSRPFQVPLSEAGTRFSACPFIHDRYQPSSDYSLNGAVGARVSIVGGSALHSGEASWMTDERQG